MRQTEILLFENGVGTISLSEHPASNHFSSKPAQKNIFPPLAFRKEEENLRNCKNNFNRILSFRSSFTSKVKNRLCRSCLSGYPNGIVHAENITFCAGMGDDGKNVKNICICWKHWKTSVSREYYCKFNKTHLFWNNEAREKLCLKLKDLIYSFHWYATHIRSNYY